MGHKTTKEGYHWGKQQPLYNWRGNKSWIIQLKHMCLLQFHEWYHWKYVFNGIWKMYGFKHKFSRYLVQANYLTTNQKHCHVLSDIGVQSIIVFRETFYEPDASGQRNCTKRGFSISETKGSNSSVNIPEKDPLKSTEYSDWTKASDDIYLSLKSHIWTNYHNWKVLKAIKKWLRR